jgi:hypothetical protein
MQYCRGFSAINGGAPSPSSVRGLVGGNVDLWYFQSPKNRRRFVLCGELLFLLAIVFEADRSILSYEPCETDDDEVGTGNARPHLRARDAIGNTFDYLTIRTRNPRNHSARRHKPGLASGVTLITDEWLYERRILLDNWIYLCAAINRVRHSPWQMEAAAMHAMLERTGGCTLRDLLALPRIDHARMLGAVADALQRGTADCDTAGSTFTLTSYIQPGGRS